MDDRDNLPPALFERFRQVCSVPSDINEHLGTLWGLARQCNHVTEFGVRLGNSTTALLAAQSNVLHCYDREVCPVLDELNTMRGRTLFLFTKIDSREAALLPTDLLFIDTTHNYACLSVELQRHAAKVRRWIALHDTQTWGARGDDGNEGMNKAIDELLAGGKWRVMMHFPHNNGLTVLQRIADE